MEFIHKGIDIAKAEAEGTFVTYYIFPEYEIHYNELSPKTEQQWHYHKTIEETIYIIEGKIEIWWIENNVKKNKKVRKGDVIRVEDSMHTLKNNTKNLAKFIVFRLILTGQDKKKSLKTINMVNIKI